MEISESKSPVFLCKVDSEELKLGETPEQGRHGDLAAQNLGWRGGEGARDIGGEGRDKNVHVYTYISVSAFFLFSSLASLSSSIDRFLTKSYVLFFFFFFFFLISLCLKEAAGTPKWPVAS